MGSKNKKKSTAKSKLKTFKRSTTPAPRLTQEKSGSAPTSKSDLKSVAVVYRPRKPEAKKIADEAVKYLISKGVTCYTHPDQEPVSGTLALPKSKISSLDFVLVVGGDGTYLNAVRMLDGEPVPVLGVNLGTLGFLTQTKKTDIKQTLDLALKCQLAHSDRLMLDVTIKRKKGPENHYLALNDVVFERGPVSRLIYLSVMANKSLVTELKADGLIVSTPTGSTAYNLAAGGPIVQPGVPAIVLTPICPHSLTDRPITLSDEQVIELQVTSEHQSAVFMVDGQREADVHFGDKIIVKKASRKHRMLLVPDHDHFEILRSKLNFGHRE